MRLMSFSMSTEQVRRREKTVTRRFGWWDLEPGTLLQPVEKAQGLRKGEHVVKIGGPIRVVSTTAEFVFTIKEYGKAELAREGFPDMTAEEFIAMLCQANRRAYVDTVNRIEFEYVDVAERMV